MQPYYAQYRWRLLSVNGEKADQKICQPAFERARLVRIVLVLGMGGATVRWGCVFGVFEPQKGQLVD